jgi:hypothetical protein
MPGGRTKLQPILRTVPQEMQSVPTLTVATFSGGGTEGIISAEITSEPQAKVAAVGLGVVNPPTPGASQGHEHEQPAPAPTHQQYQVQMQPLSSSATADAPRNTGRFKSELGPGALSKKNSMVAGKWPGAAELRRVFKSMDVNNDQTLSPEELRVGLAKLGFKDINEKAWKRLIAEVDSDNTGSLTENEFIKMFRTFNQEQLAKKLNEQTNLKKEDVEVNLVVVAKNGKSATFMEHFYGAAKFRSSGAEVVAQLFPVEIADAAPPRARSTGSVEAKNEAKDGKKRTERSELKWIDITGYQEPVLDALSNSLNFDRNLLFSLESGSSSASAKLYRDGKKQFEVVLHCYTLQNYPLGPKPKGASACWDFLSLSTTKEVTFKNREPLQLADYDVKNKPIFDVHPVHLVVAGPSTFVSFRRNSGAEVKEMLVPLVKYLREQFEGVSAESIVLPPPSPTKFLSTAVEQVNFFNWDILEKLNDWHDAIDQGLENGTDPVYQVQIPDLESIVQRLNKDVENMHQTLAGMISGKNRDFNEFIVDTELSEPANQQEKDKQITTACDAYQETMDRLGKLKEECATLVGKTSTLSNKYKAKQSDEANRTLYFLSCVTAFLAPVQLATGIYGMNFDNLPELHFQNGYFVLLGCILAWFLLLFTWVVRKMRIFK